VALGVFLFVLTPGGKDSIVDLSWFGRGIVLGLAVAAPVGPMSLLCMRRTLAVGFSAGLLSGLGVASADALYGAVAAFGLVAVTSVLVSQALCLRLIGGAALIYLGIKTVRTAPADAAASSPDTTSPIAMYASMVALTLTNPTTILSFAGLFAGVGLGESDGDPTSAATMVLGVFLGSAVWWLALTGGISLARQRLTAGVRHTINRLSGLALIVLGLLALASLLG
jgi:threonine/homoserine/homoserine lactone efflux protein